MASSEEITKTKLEKIRRAVTAHPDFPKPGIIFKDIFPIFRDAVIFQDLISVMEDQIKETFPHVEVLVGLEARGFLFAPLLAYNLGISFVPIRKKGKLPGEVVSVTYKLEYGEDTFEIQKDCIKPGSKVIVVDDLLATGGTLKAAIDLVRKIKGKVLECLTVLELTELKGRDNLNIPVATILQF